jgi:hypothetical protein
VVLAAVLIALIVLVPEWRRSRESPPGPPLPEQAGLPEAVARMRERIYAAAVRGDYEALRPLIPPGGFRYSFGNGGDPIEFWRELETREGERPLQIMAAILRVPYTIVRAGDVVYYVWPFVFDRPIDSLTPEELALVRTFATDEQIAGWREFGAYIGYRLGIRADGTWLYFVAGD